jgi:hypothetical protein
MMGDLFRTTIEKGILIINHSAEAANGLILINTDFRTSFELIGHTSSSGNLEIISEL